MWQTQWLKGCQTLAQITTECREEKFVLSIRNYFGLIRIFTREMHSIFICKSLEFQNILSFQIYSSLKLYLNEQYLQSSSSTTQRAQNDNQCLAAGGWDGYQITQVSIANVLTNANVTDSTTANVIHVCTVETIYQLLVNNTYIIS